MQALPALNLFQNCAIHTSLLSHLLLNCIWLSIFASLLSARCAGSLSGMSGEGELTCSQAELQPAQQYNNILHSSNLTYRPFLQARRLKVRKESNVSVQATTLTLTQVS